MQHNVEKTWKIAHPTTNHLCICGPRRAQTCACTCITPGNPCMARTHQHLTGRQAISTAPGGSSSGPPPRCVLCAGCTCSIPVCTLAAQACKVIIAALATYATQPHQHITYKLKSCGHKAAHDSWSDMNRKM